MLVPFLIMLREGVEAALIVAIVASYLDHVGRGDAMRSVWIGVAAAVALSAAIGVAIAVSASELPQRLQELFEAAVGLFAAVMLTAMALWMGKAAKSIRAALHAGIEKAFASGSQGVALAGLAFFAVAREGIESVLFLMAAWQQRDDVGIEALFGAVGGLVVAIGVGIALHRGGRRFNLAGFFRWTGLFILFVAAGLLAGALRALHEAGLWNGLQGIAFDLSRVLPTDGFLGALLAGVFGYADAPTWGEVALWLAYFIPALILFRRATAPAAPIGKPVIS
ncbi:iron transporter [Rhodoblastus sphagnicola]|uniref:Iron transporter n=1 Tax=Rhodoblastus sphagnicola TaxID=333368 RepID=A0A2S6MXA5_9HYPH|nr:iron uptake transporter permease EfeU [Rhodoblastus sphagnicola]MBB4199316.1 high-affinity iron transporter [Rhodoblastus sphagnicola]PPQ26979.1 iron transporter [Rhodoblastus sphagnicola]